MYIILFRYGRGENYSLYGQHAKHEDAEKALWNNIYDFLSYGPDDISELHLLKINKAGADKLNAYIASGKSQDSIEFINLMDDIYNNHCLKHCYTINGAFGNCDIAEMAEKDGINSDDLWDNDKLYYKYLKKYIKDLEIEYFISRIKI